MQAMQQHGKNPAGLWKLINCLAKARQPRSRDQRRCLCLRFWGAVRELLRFRVLYRHGPLIATSNFATRPKPRSPRRLSPSVGASTSKMTGSKPVMGVVKMVQNTPQTTDRELVGRDGNTVGSALEGKSAPPTAAEISEAARSLAQRPRTRKLWTGWVRGERMWRLREVIVPGGQVLPVVFVRRGFVYVLLPDAPAYEHRAYERYRANDVRIYRSPSAALLGRLPPREGRRRGRPHVYPRQRPSQFEQ